jgi:hypothetical protein
MFHEDLGGTLRLIDVRCVKAPVASHLTGEEQDEALGGVEELTGVIEDAL